MRLSPRSKIGTALVLLVVFFVVLNLTGFQKEVKNFFYLISSPIQEAFWRVGDRISDFFETVTEIKNLKTENEEFKLKIQELLAENIALKEFKKENEILRTALEIGLEKDFELILAQVIGKDISQDFILINKGLKDGISKDSPVINQQKVLFGKIQEVYDNFSKVMLITDKKSSFDAKILAPYQTEGFGAGSDSEIYGIVKGKGNLQLYLDLIPQDKEIKEGDLIVTTPLGGIFPSGLLVGKIKEVRKSDIEPVQQAEISPLFDIKETEYLFIITNFNQ